MRTSDTTIVVGTIGAILAAGLLGWAFTSELKENPVRKQRVDIRRYPEAQILDPHEKQASWYLIQRKLSEFPGVTEQIDEWIAWNLGDEIEEDDMEFDDERSSERDRVDQLSQAMADPEAFTKAHPIMLTSEGIIDGFHRAAALRQMGMFDEPVFVLYAPEI